MKNLITKSQLEKLKLSNSRGVDEAIELAKEVCEFIPANAMFFVRDEDGKKVFDSAIVKLQHENLFFTISFQEYTKKYDIRCKNLNDLKNLDYSSINNIAGKNLSEPVTMGKLSTKKIMDWVKYYESLYNLCFIADKENGEKKQAFIDSIKELPVKWNNRKDGGYVVMNGIELDFTINTTYISKNIKLHYDMSNTVETFLALANNKFKAVNKYQTA